MIINIICTILIIIMVTLFYYEAKNLQTYHCQLKVADAILRYSKANSLSCKEAGKLLDQMEDYDITLGRWWDWSCKRIVSEELYERIKEYING